jgi:hypothetical protein
VREDDLLMECCGEINEYDDEGSVGVDYVKSYLYDNEKK